MFENYKTLESLKITDIDKVLNKFEKDEYS